MNLILLRCEDERVNARKGAIVAMEQLFLKLNDPEMVNVCVEKLKVSLGLILQLQDWNFHAIKVRCRDQSLAVRKCAAESLTRLLSSTIGEIKFQSTWLHYVMLLITDREMGVQQLCARLFSVSI